MDIIEQYRILKNEKPGDLSGYEHQKLQMFCHNNPDEWVDTLLNHPFKNYHAKIEICDAMFLHGEHNLNLQYHQWIKPYFMKVYENTKDDDLFLQHLEWILRVSKI